MTEGTIKERTADQLDHCAVDLEAWDRKVKAVHVYLRSGGNDSSLTSSPNIAPSQYLRGIDSASTPTTINLPADLLPVLVTIPPPTAEKPP